MFAATCASHCRALYWAWEKAVRSLISVPGAAAPPGVYQYDLPPDALTKPPVVTQQRRLKISLASCCRAVWALLKAVMMAALAVVQFRNRPVPTSTDG